MTPIPLAIATATKSATLESLSRLIGQGRISVSVAVRAYPRFRRAQELREAIQRFVHPEYTEFFTDEMNCGELTEARGSVVRNGSTWHTNKFSGEIGVTK